MLLDKNVIEYVFYNQNQLSTSEQKELIKLSLIKYNYKTNETNNTRNFSKLIVKELFDIMGWSYKESTEYDFIVNNHIGVNIQSNLYNSGIKESLIFGLPYHYRYLTHTKVDKLYIILMLNNELIDIPNDEETKKYMSFFANNGVDFRYLTQLIYNMEIDVPIQWRNHKNNNIDISNIISKLTKTQDKTTSSLIYRDISLNNGYMLLDTIVNYGIQFKQYIISDKYKVNICLIKCIRDHLTQLLTLLHKYQDEYNNNLTAKNKRLYGDLLKTFNDAINKNKYTVNTSAIYLFISKTCLNNILTQDENKNIISQYGNIKKIYFDFDNLKRLSLILNSVKIVYGNIPNDNSTDKPIIITIDVDNKDKPIKVSKMI